jgi:hypothetical protein
LADIAVNVRSGAPVPTQQQRASGMALLRYLKEFEIRALLRTGMSTPASHARGRQNL